MAKSNEEVSNVAKKELQELLSCFPQYTQPKNISFQNQIATGKDDSPKILNQQIHKLSQDPDVEMQLFTMAHHQMRKSFINRERAGARKVYRNIAQNVTKNLFSADQIEMAYSNVYTARKSEEDLPSQRYALDLEVFELAEESSQEDNGTDRLPNNRSRIQPQRNQQIRSSSKLNLNSKPGTLSLERGGKANPNTPTIQTPQVHTPAIQTPNLQINLNRISTDQRKDSHINIQKHAAKVEKRRQKMNLKDVPIRELRTKFPGKFFKEIEDLLDTPTPQTQKQSIFTQNVRNHVQGERKSPRLQKKKESSDSNDNYGLREVQVQKLMELWDNFATKCDDNSEQKRRCPSFLQRSFMKFLEQDQRMEIDGMAAGAPQQQNQNLFANQFGNHANVTQNQSQQQQGNPAEMKFDAKQVIFQQQQEINHLKFMLLQNFPQRAYQQLPQFSNQQGQNQGRVTPQMWFPQQGQQQAQFQFQHHGQPPQFQKQHSNQQQTGPLNNQTQNSQQLVPHVEVTNQNDCQYQFQYKYKYQYQFQYQYQYKYQNETEQEPMEQ